MPFKISFLFNGTTGASANSESTARRPFGFSETWYRATEPTKEILTNVCKERMWGLPETIAPFGYRVGEVGVARSKVIMSEVTTTGWRTQAINATPDAAFCKVIGTAAGNPVKRFFLHCLPDGWVWDSQFYDTSTVQPRSVKDKVAALRRYLNALRDNAFLFKYNAAGLAEARILSITADGIVTVDRPVNPGPNGYITIQRCRDTNGKPVRGNYVVQGAGGVSFTIRPWEAGRTVGRSGRVRPVIEGYTGFTIPDDWLIRIAGRKVGRPFGAVRGRSSARR